MFLTPWLRSVQSRLRKSSRRLRRAGSKPSFPARNRLESLEDRTLLAATVQLVGTDLRILSDANEDVVVQEDPANAGNIEVLINGTPSMALGIVRADAITALTVLTGDGDNSVDLNGVNATLFSSLTTITVATNDGNDTITASADIATSIDAGQGDDSVVGGDGNDCVLGGNGDDTIFGNGGDDTLVGGGGADSLDGGSGDDLVQSVLTTVEISDAVLNLEGGAGASTTLTFTLTLSTAFNEDVIVSYSTSDDTATSGLDYTAAAGFATFSAGQVTTTIDIAVAGDLAIEGNETFFVNLTGISGPATIADAQALGTIVDDELTFPDVNIDGLAQDPMGAQRPDTVGAVGPNHYVQAAHRLDSNGVFESHFTVYDKSGNLVQTPTSFRSLNPTFPFDAGAGDPIVLYDHLADRWVLTEGTGNITLVFVSETADPTGPYYSYQFAAGSPGAHFTKIAVWPDAYFVSLEERDAIGDHAANAAFALDRANMLQGLPARAAQRFTAPDLVGYQLRPQTQALTVGDLDGSPPPAGSPGYFMRHRDDEFHSPGANNPSQDFLEVWQFRVDFANPTNSSFTRIADIPITDFDTDSCAGGFACIPQPGTAVALDDLGAIISHRLQYRNFGTHETLVGNFTEEVAPAQFGLRWFELRKVGGSGWTLFQEGTHAPDSTSRFLGSISMDGNGNIAIGYNVSSSTVFPGLRYAGRLATDPLGTLPQGEHIIINGTGSQTSDSFFGDYSALTVDPSDDRTFWFTGEYILSAGNWATRIASFNFGDVAPSVATPVLSSQDADDTLLGGDGNDQIAVHYSGGDIIVDGGLGTDVVRVSDSGLGNAGSVDIDGGDGTDIFSAAPLLGGVLSFDGNTPASTPGDLLTVSLLDPSISNPVIVDNVNGGAMDGTGSVTSTSHGSMSWTGIEALNLLDDSDLVLDADLALPFGGDGADSGVADSFQLFRTGNFGQLELNGTTVAVFPVNFLTSITVNGSTDDDTLTVDLSTGAFPLPITFNGLTAVGDNDQLRIIGSGTETATYLPSTTVDGDGVITINGNDLTFTDLEPIEVTNMASFTLQTPNSQDDITLSPARNFANTDDALLVSGTSGGIGFESVRLLDVVNLTINLAAADGALSNDMVTIENGALLFDPTDLLTNITILAGQGNDTFEIQDSEFQLPGGGTLTLDGGVATDTIRVIAQNDAAETDVALTLATAGPNATLTSTAGAMPATIQLLNFSGEIAALTGNSGDNLIDLSGWSVNNQQSTATIAGGSSGDDLLDGDDTLIGFNDDTVWAITNAFGPDSGDATGINFRNIDNLVGGSGNDIFTVQNGVTFSGTVDGGAGNDQLDLSDFTTARTVALTASSATGFNGTSSAVTGGFFGINDVLGGLAITDSLQGLNVNSTWDLDGRNRYIDNLGRVLTFGAFERLQGGAANDVFQITGTRSNDLLGGDGEDIFRFQIAFSQVVGRVDGQAGADTLNLSALTTQRVVTLTSTTSQGFSGTEASVTANFSGIDTIVGGFAATDVLNGLATDSRWDVSGPNRGTYTESPTARVLTFSQIENLNGNNGVDTFDFSNQATLTGSLTGGAGFDTLIGDDSRASEVFVVNAVNAGQFVSPTGPIIGGTFSGIETLVGAQGQDTFQFTNTGSLAGVIDGVGGADTIVGDNDGNTFIVSNNDAGDLPGKFNTAGLGVTGFINVENLTGGAGTDIFTVNSLLVGNIRGQSGNDQFLFGATGAIGKILFGGPGFDTLTGDDDGNLFNIEGNGALSAIGKGTLVTKTGEFQEIETLVGGAGDDTFSFTRLGSIIGTVNGAGGVNTIVGDDDGNNFTVSATNAGLLAGKMTAFSMIQNLEGGAANDTFNINSTLDGNILALVGADSIIINTLGVVGGNVDAGALNDFIEIRGRVIGNVDAGSQNDTIVLQNGAIVDGTVFGNSGDDLFSIRGTVTLGNDLMGDAGNDTFEFLNSGSINTAINGGADSDTIKGDDDGNVFTITGPNSGTLPDKVPAGYVSIENLTGGSGIDVFNVNASLSGSLSGQGGDDQFNIADGLTIGGAINGDAGNDTLNVDYSGGAARTLTYNGGSGNDLLRLTGTVAGGSTTYSVGPAADQGTVATTLAGGGTPGQTITFTGLEPIEDLMTLASLIINASLGADIINIIDAPTAGQTEVNFNNAFELIRFQNKTMVAVNGRDGNDTVNVNNPNPATGLTTLSVNGENGNDTINVLVSHTGNIQGGAGADSFVFTNGVQLTGNIDGGSGSDTLNTQAYSSNLAFNLTGSSVNGYSGTEASLLSGAGTYAGIDSIRGGSAVDQLTGLDVNSIWGLDGTNTYTDDMARVLAFSLLETLNGGSMADTFNVTGFQSETLNGGAGDDRLNMTASGAFLNGPFNGGAGTDTVSLSGLTAGQSVTLTANGSIDGFNGSTSSIIGGFQNVDSLTGSAGTDTITGSNVVAIWEIDGTNTFEDDPTNRMLAFSAFENLQGGGLSDRFNVTGNQTNNILGGVGDDVIAFADLATLNGTINGESGSDIVDYSAYVSGGVMAMVGSFISIEQIIGGTTAADFIVGGSGNDVFAVTDANQGTVNGIAFSAFENLDGRNGNDSFDFQTSGTLSGAVEGGNGSDSLSISRPGLLTVNLTGAGIATMNATANGVAGNETAIGGGFNNINSVTATGSDILNGADANSTWTLGTTNTYAVSGQSATFSGFATLNGGNQADTFNANSSVSFNINGGAGNDSVTLAASVALSGAVSGGVGMDTLSLATGAMLNGAFNGGADLDTVSFATSTTAVTINLLSSSATGFAGSVAAITGNFTDVDRLNGSAAAGDTLNGRNVNSVWTLDTPNTYFDMANSVEFSSFETLNGGTQDDTFNVRTARTASLIGNGGNDSFNFQTNTASLTGSISGGSGNNSLSFAGLTTVAAGVTLTGNNGNGFAGGAGSLVSGGFSGIFTLTGGGSTNDTLTGQNVSATWEVNPVGDTYRDDSSGRTLNFNLFENLTGGMLDDSFTIDALATLNGSISDLGGGDVVTLESDGLGAGAVVTGGISTGASGDIVRIEDDATVGGLIDTGAGNDIIEVSYDGGTTRTLNVAVGSGDDDLQLDGSVATAVVNYTVGPGSDQGTIATTIGANTQTVIFSGLNPADDDVLLDRQDGATININGSTNADVITVQDGLQNITFFTEVDFNGVFPAIQFQNKARAVINGGSNADTFNLNNPMMATGLNLINVEGGDGNDTVNVQVNHTGDLNGGAGNDLFVFSNGVTVAGEMANAVNGGSGTDTIDVSAFTTDTPVTLSSNSSSGFTGNIPAVIIGGPFTGIDNILAGSGGADSLTGLDTTATWQLDGSDTYTDTVSFRSLSFANFEDLVGNSMADTFDITGPQTVGLRGLGGNDTFRFLTDDAAIDGSIEGDTGNDTLDFSALSSSVSVSVQLDGAGTSGFNGNVSQITGGFLDIDSVIAGNSTSDSLTGINAIGAWTVDNPGNYLANGQSLDFTNFENLNGNDAADVFMIQNGSFNLAGAAGDDIFNVQDGVTLTGTIDGGDHAAGDTLSFAASTTAIAFPVSLVTNVENIDGSGTGNDTVVGTDGDDVFEISGADTGTVNGATFTSFANLDGGLGNDSFQFTADAGSLTGSIEGGAGSDTLGFSGVTGNIGIDLTGAGGTDGFSGNENGGTFNGFLNINVLEGGQGTGDTLTGLNLDSTWTLGTTSTYVSGGSSVEFTLNTANGFENLVGQSMDDDFNVSGTQAANITAGNGDDAVNLAASAMLTGTVTTGADDDLFTFGTGAMVIGSIDAGTNDDTLAFSSSTTNVAISLEAANAGGGFDGVAPALITFGGMNAFAGINHIVGGTGMNSLTGLDTNSTWRIGAANSYEENSAPANVLDFSGIRSAIGGAAVDTFNVTGSTSLNLSGGDGADAFNVVGTANVTGSLNGDAGNDTFTFTGAAIVPAALDGGADSDTVSFATSITAVSINLDTFTNVEMVTGTSISDTIVGSTGNDAFTVAGANNNGSVVSGVTGVTTNFVSFENLSGASGNDSFAISDTFGLSGAISGGAGTDTIDYSNYTTGVTVNLTSGTATNIAGGISTLENITGGLGGDMLTGSTASNNLVGGMGDDVFFLPNGGSDLIDDGAGVDTINFSLATGPITIDLDSSLAQTVQSGHTVTLDTDGIENFVGSGANDVVRAAILGVTNRSINGGGGSDRYETTSNGINTWTFDGANAGRLGTASLVNLTSVENVTGGTDSDMFNFHDGGSLSGVLDGNTGTDTVSYAAPRTQAVNLDLGRLTSIENLVGSVASDTLTAASSGTDFIINSGNGGTAQNMGSATVMQFIGFENLQGGAANDSFTFGQNGALSGGLNGGGSTSGNSLTLSIDNDDVSLTSLSLTTGFSGTVLDEVAAPVTTFANINSVLAGAGGADELSGLDATASWTLNDGAADLYQSGGRSLTINEFETYSGGSGADSFNINGAQSIVLNGEAGSDLFSFAPGASHSGVIDGGTGTDTIDFVNGAPAESIMLSNVAADGFVGVTGRVNLFQDIDAIDGTGTDSLATIPMGFPTTFNLSTIGSTLQAGGQSLSFRGVVSLTGSGEDDIFNVTGVHAVNISAGAGNDRIVMQTNSSNITGTIDGGAQTTADVLDLSLLSLGRIVDSASLTDIESVIGTSGNDTLIGSAAGSVFQVTGMSNAGVLDGTLNFSSVETLLGGAGADSFSIDDTLTIGAVIGGAGADTLNLANYTTARNVALSAVSASNGFTGSETAVATFTGINTITASAQLGEQITGFNTDATFTLNGTSTSTYATGGTTLTLNDFEIFTGNAGRDQFNVTGNQTATANGGGGNDTLAISNGVVFNGVFTGGSGSDTIDLSAYSTAVAFTLGNLGTTDGFRVSAGPLSMTANDVNAIIGGSSVDTVTGRNAAANWSLGATDTYTSTNSLTIRGVEIRFGGTAVDTFDVQANALPATVHQLFGQAGNDIFNVNFAAGTSLAAGASLGIAGGAPGLDIANPDTVNLNVNAPGDGARSIVLTYGSASTGDLTVSGLGMAPINLIEVESFNLKGDSANNDTVNVIGTSGMDALTVTPTANGATVLLNGATNFVNGGVAGGGDGPDISIMGVSQTGLTVNGAGSSDDLLYNGAGTVNVATALSGTITQSGVVNVNYTNMENLTTAQASGYILNAQGDANNGGADNFLVELNGSGIVEVSVNSSLLLRKAPGSINGLTINGSSDNDTLTVDFTSGNPIPTNLLFNGGAGADDLVSIGGTTGIYAPSATTTGNGVLTIDGSAITFTGLEPVTVMNLTNLTFTSPRDADVISVTSPGVGQNLVSGTSGGLAFEPLLFSGVANFTLDALANSISGSDVITIGDISGIGLNSFSISTGVGADTVNASAVTAVDLTINTGPGNDVITGGLGNDTIDGGTGIDGIIQTVDGFQGLSNTSASGAGTDSLSNIETATLNGGAGDDTIGATAFTGDLIINTGNGSNLVNSGSGNDLVIGGLGRDTLNGGGGNDTLFGSGDKDSLNGGLGDDVLKGQGATGDSLTGGPGNDFLDGGAGVDIVVESSTGNITLTDTQLFANGIDNLANIEQASLTAGDGNDIIDVTGFTTSLGTFLYGGLGDDTIRGAEFRDVIFGLEGDDLLIGNGGDDDLMGSSGRDILIGGAGNDRLRGQGGSGDVLIGGLGDDILDGGAGNDRLIATGDVNFVLTDALLTGLGTDTILNTEFATLNGGDSGNTIDASGTTNLVATLNGLGGADTITGGSPAELINGGSGNDTINGGGGDDTIDGGSGNDLIDGGSGSDRLVVSADANLTTTDSQTTGAGTDTFSNIELVELTGGAGANRLDASGATLPTIQNGGDGNDTLVAGDGIDFLDGGDGIDVTSLSGTNVVLTNASFNGTDTVINVEIVNVTAGATSSRLDASAYTLGSVNLIGGPGNDTLLGGSGNDTLSGNDGNDSIVGGAGNDTATGGIGNDTIAGGDGNDNLNGNGGNDFLTGEGGNDLARGGTGNDTILGGAGSDTLEGEDGNDSIRGGAANDTINGGRNNDTLFGDDGDDSIIGGLGEDGISGGLGNDYLLGDFGNDTIIGQAGNDNILGSAGDDVLMGGDGNDLVRGNGGRDTLDGNMGMDTLIGSASEIDENFSEANFPFLL